MATSATPREIGGESTDTETAQQAALRLLVERFDDHYAKVFRYLLHRFFDGELAEELTVGVSDRVPSELVSPDGKWVVMPATQGRIEIKAPAGGSK